MDATAEFRFSSGRLSLDLPATIRKRLSKPFDALSPPGATARWLQESRLVDGPMQLTEAQLNRVDALRQAIWELAGATSCGATLPRAAADILNAAAALPLAVPRLNARTGGSEFVAQDPFESALATIARDAIDLVTGPSKSRIKSCAQNDCGMLFFDSSRSGRRRWCSMDRCGSRAKGLAFRNRQMETRV
jgi:predicted RNA-binding Zn ribbon-like protein